VKGDVYGIRNNTTEIAYIQFDIGLAAGGYPIDTEQLNIIYSDSRTTPKHIANITGVYDEDAKPAANSWLIAKKSGTGITDPDNDHVLKFGQTFTIRLNATEIPPRENIHVEIKPEVGASLAISRTVPPSITNTTLLT